VSAKTESYTNNMVEVITVLGGLHDAVLSRFLWQSQDNRLELEIDDLHANFRGLPGYEGPTRATLVFTRVTHLDIHMNFCTEGLMIYDWKSDRVGPENCTSEILFSPGGRITIVFGGLQCVKK
jgi:hypothetical protein